MNEEMMEKFADAAHEVWSSWIHHILKKYGQNADGDLVIPKDEIERRRTLANTPYRNLSEEEKEKDRDVVRNYYEKLADFS